MPISLTAAQIMFVTTIFCGGGMGISSLFLAVRGRGTITFVLSGAGAAAAIVVISMAAAALCSQSVVAVCFTPWVVSLMLTTLAATFVAMRLIVQFDVWLYRKFTRMLLSGYAWWRSFSHYHKGAHRATA